MNSQFHNAFRTNGDSAAQPLRRPGFTLVELMVVIVIISIVASLSLAGLGVARQKSKIDATKATIRKINEPIMEQYESYAVTTTGTTIAAMNSDLTTIRQRMVEEMPDDWNNVNTSLAACSTAPGRAYVKYKATGASADFQSAECLYMVVTRSGFSPGVLENFRPTEVGDADKDGKKEFLDSWGNPIAFLRWAPGFSAPYSAIQIADKTNSHDPLDVRFFVSGTGSDLNSYQLYPLIYSGGPDEAGDVNSTVSNIYGIVASQNGWANADLLAICDKTGSTGQLIGAPDSTPDRSQLYRDNVTNHDFLGRGR